MATDDLKLSRAAQQGGSKGSLGGATASDLQRGYFQEPREPEPPLWTPTPPSGGFVGRAEGWER